jgi:hypothetical protein
MAAEPTLGAEEEDHLDDLDREELPARAPRSTPRCATTPRSCWSTTSPVPAIRQPDGPYRERVREALSDPAVERRGLFRPETVERMLREPDATRTALGSNAVWQPALLETCLQKVEDLAR